MYCIKKISDLSFLEGIALQLRGFQLSAKNNPKLRWYCFATLPDWLTKPTPLIQPIRFKTEYQSWPKHVRLPALGAGHANLPWTSIGFDWLGTDHYFLRWLDNFLFVTFRLCMMFLFGGQSLVQELLNVNKQVLVGRKHMRDLLFPTAPIAWFFSAHFAVRDLFVGNCPSKKQWSVPKVIHQNQSNRINLTRLLWFWCCMALNWKPL